MTAAFEQAWALLKAAFVPTDPEQQLGAGMFRSVYGQEGNPDVSKFGYGGLADMSTLDALSQMYPELFLGERPAYLDYPEGGLPDWVMRRPTGEPIADTRELGTEVGMAFPSTQKLGVPIEMPEGYRRQEWLQRMGKPILGSVYDRYPLTEQLQMWDIKPENWLGTEGGAVSPAALGSSTPGGAKLMDPQFLAPKFQYGKIQDVNVDPETIEQFARKVAPIEQFAKPWEQMSDKFGTPSQQDSFEDMLMTEEERMQLIRDSLGL